MALQLLAVLPSEGPTAGGTLVRICAPGLEPQPPAEPGAFIAPAETAVVTFGGIPATAVSVLNRAELTCITPARMPGAVDVVVTNLVTAESSTAAGGFEYKRPDLLAVTSIESIGEALRARWARNILTNTLVSQDTDYDGSPADRRDLVTLAELPAIVISGPRLDRDEDRDTYRPTTALNASTGRYQIRKSSIAFTARYDINVLTNTMRQLYSLMSAILFDFNASRQIETADGPLDMEFTAGGDLRILQRRSASNLHQAVGEVMIGGIRVEDVPGFRDSLDAMHTRAVEQICITTRRR